jgi:hypothetical protein
MSAMRRAMEKSFQEKMVNDYTIDIKSPSDLEQYMEKHFRGGDRRAENKNMFSAARG